MNRLQRDHLVTLMNHFAGDGPLGIQEFTIRWFLKIHDDGSTSGCGIGECPFVWPDEWVMTERQPHISSEYSPIVSAAKWFGLNIHQTFHLFSYNAQDVETYGGVILTEESSRHDFAENIRIFLERTTQAE